MNRILITGGTGLIGSALINKLANNVRFTVLTRNSQTAAKQLPDTCEFIQDLTELENLDAFTVVINLAGEPIVDKRWSDEQKRIIEQSRFDITTQLVALFHLSEQAPSVFISGSAIGFYGRQGDTPIDEEYTRVHDEFSHRLCEKWEALATQASSAGTRVCLLRTGIVLAANGGALGKMHLPFKMGLGGPIASGKQYMSWIHIDDMVSGIEHLINNDASNGVYNLTAPHPATNRDFAHTLGKALHRPAILPMPEFALRLLMGESADLLVYGQNVLPRALELEGFHFRYPKLEQALADLL